MRSNFRQYILLAGISVGSLSTYLYQVAIARVLGPVPYGLVASIFAIMAVIGIVASGLSPIAAKSSKANVSNDRSWKIKEDVLFKTTLAASGLLVIGLVIFAVSAGQYVRLGTLPLVLVSAYIPIAAVFAIAVGRMQGSNQLGEMTWVSTGSAVLKLATILPVYFFTLGATGSVALSVISAALSVAIAMHITKDLKPGDAIIWDHKSIKTIVILTAFWTLSNSDLVAVKVLSTDESAGLYAAAVSLGRICVVLTIIYAQYRFSRFLTVHEMNKGFNSKFISGTLAPVLALGLAIMSIFVLAGESLTRLLYGSLFAEASNLLVSQAVLSILISINFVLLNLLIICEAKYSLAITIFAVLVASIGYLFSGVDAYSKFVVLLIANVILLIGFVWLLITTQRKSKVIEANE